MTSPYISKITSILLTKYNSKFDELQKEFDSTQKTCNDKQLDIKKIMKSYLTDLTKLDKSELFNLTNLEDKPISLTKINCNYTSNPKQISEINFIQDLNLVKKIIDYRQQEIWKELALIQMYITIYNNIIVKILNIKLKDTVKEEIIKYVVNVFNYNNDDINLDQNEKYTSSNLKKLLEFKIELEEILKNNVINNKQFLLKNILCKYKFLEEQLKKIIDNVKLENNIKIKNII